MIYPFVAGEKQLVTLSDAEEALRVRARGAAAQLWCGLIIIRAGAVTEISLKYRIIGKSQSALIMI
eukprot:COSAG01_NODE_47723_length_387_cov_2.079861_1_plen_65_part_10